MNDVMKSEVSRLRSRVTELKARIQELEKDTKRPMVGVAVFIVRDGHILMSKRLKGNGAGQYGLPGGHMEHGEAPEQCCEREAKEETGLDVYDIKFLTVVNKSVLENGKHYITLFFKAKCLLGSQPKDREPKKHGPWIWYPTNDLPSPCFEDFDRLIKEYFGKETR